MPSEKKIVAYRVARHLRSAEVAANEALLRVLALGTAVVTPRTDGTVHPLEAQLAVEHVGSATARIFEALADLGRSHAELRAVGVRLGMIFEGDIFRSPDSDTPRGLSVVPLPVSAIAA